MPISQSGTTEVAVTAVIGGTTYIWLEEGTVERQSNGVAGYRIKMDYGRRFPAQGPSAFSLFLLRKTLDPPPPHMASLEAQGVGLGET